MVQNNGLRSNNVSQQQHVHTCGLQPNVAQTPSSAGRVEESAASDNNWETIETTVMHPHNGSQETYTRTRATTHQSNPAINSIDIMTDEGTFEQFWECIESLMLRFRFSIKTKEVYRNSILVFNRVDKWAGRLFPLTFLMLNFIYWSSYMYIL